MNSNGVMISLTIAICIIASMIVSSIPIDDFGSGDSFASEHRNRRQSLYLTCGSSGSTSCPSSSSCSSNSQCSSSSVNATSQLGLCIGGCCCVSSANQTLSTSCFGGPAIAMAINGQCGQSLSVYNGFCCACSTGVASTQPCVNNLCPFNFTCNRVLQVCCPSNTTTSSTTLTGSIGVCINGACPVGFFCFSDNNCYPASSNIGTSIGPCIAGACPVNYTCSVTNQCFLATGKRK